MLCHLCDCLSITRLNRGGHHHVPNASALDNSAAKGCEFCSLIRAVLSRVSPEPLGSARTTAFTLSLARVGRREGLWLHWSGDVNDGIKAALRTERGGALEDRHGRMHLFVAPDSRLAGTIAGREVHARADSEAVFGQIASWMKDCIHNHPNLAEDARLCQDMSQSYDEIGRQQETQQQLFQVRDADAHPAEELPLLPTRVIDVGPSDGSKTPFLVETERELRGLYVTLSHCWGASRPLVTDAESLAARKAQVPESELPETFRNAVLITRRLGVRYLWIDSLCILQGTEARAQADWQREAALMDQYYNKSLLTISAAGAAGSEQGCFLPRETTAGRVRLNLKQSLAVMTKVPRKCLPCLSPRIQRDVMDGPLPGGSDVYVSEMPPNVPFIHSERGDGRAWILQETALSPRLLIYGQDMVAWLCNTRHCTERGDDIRHDTSSHYVMAPRLPHHLRHAPGYSSEDVRWRMALRWVTMEASTWWAKMVQNYSRRRLTYEADKLPAISGCARAIQDLNKDDYYSGLWKRTLTNDLLWQSVASRTASRPATYRAPSWSWASIEGEVKCCITPKYHDINEKLIELLSMEAEYVGPDVFGQVRTMSLLVNGSPARVRLGPRVSGDAGESCAENPIHLLEAIDDACACSTCVQKRASLKSLQRNVIASGADATRPRIPNFSAVGAADVYLSQDLVTMRHTGLEGGPMGNSGPQYTETTLNIGDNGLMDGQILEHDGLDAAGSASFDVESDRDMAADDLCCLPVNRQFGLLLVRNGPLVVQGEAVESYRRVGLVKLNLMWRPAHELSPLALV
ncbi:HET domain protein [Metarhizium guizhouense ARSEF 977]|uniref:HET domain protein n=1 Tax=Metarhizium guizhouense (strain ARSEF 977) TaxID=1276136 RepID=A0A0B4GZK6_METGA|nr:HET domain protein [Metarhizium guizhouense ARSEF 977]